MGTAPQRWVQKVTECALKYIGSRARQRLHSVTRDIPTAEGRNVAGTSPFEAAAGRRQLVRAHSRLGRDGGHGLASKPFTGSPAPDYLSFREVRLLRENWKKSPTKRCLSVADWLASGGLSRFDRVVVDLDR